MTFDELFAHWGEFVASRRSPMPNEVRLTWKDRDQLWNSLPIGLHLHDMVLGMKVIADDDYPKPTFTYSRVDS